MNCKKCGSVNLQVRGNRRGKKRVRCMDCRTWGVVSEEEAKNIIEGRFKPTNEKATTFQQEGDDAELNFKTSKRIRNVEDLMEFVAPYLNTNEWEIEKYVLGSNEAWRKDKKTDWQVKDGVTNGESHDTGKIVVEPVFSVKVYLKRKTTEIRKNLALEDLANDVKTYSFDYKPIRYNKIKDGLLYEIAIPDLHIGRLAWGEETGEDTDLKLQVQRTEMVIENILSHSEHYPIEKIILPIGHDWFNSDSYRNETTHGVRQSEDTRWRKTYREGRILAVKMIE